METKLDPVSVKILKLYNCNSCEELYTKLEKIHEEHKPIEGEHFPFSLQDLKQLSTSDSLNEITENLGTYWRANKADELIKYLRKNPPKDSYENPVI